MFPLRDTIPSRRVPVVTYGLIAVNIAVFIYQLTQHGSDLAHMVYVYGLVPKRIVNPVWAARNGFPHMFFLPLVTNMFLHGGWLHIISNMWSLWIFGDNIEDRMGSLRYLAFYFLCGIIANVISIVVNPFSTTPLIGASGAIAGVLGAYLVLFPLSRVICLVPIFFYPLLLEIPAFVFIVVWTIAQIFNGTASLFARDSNVGGIAWFAHIGGFFAGLLLYKSFLLGGPRKNLPADTAAGEPSAPFLKGD